MARFISSNSNSDYSVTLDSEYSIFKTDIHFNVEFLTVPNTYYNIYSPQTIVFEDSQGTPHGIVIAAGQYDSTSFLDYLTGEMSTLDPVENYSYTLDPPEIVSGGGEFELFFPELISKYLGFTYTDVLQVSVLGVLVLGVLDFERTKVYYILSNLGTGEISYHSSSDKTLTKPSEITILGIFSSSGKKLEPATNTLRGWSVRSFKIGLYDEELVPIDTNGHKWTVSIYFFV